MYITVWKERLVATSVSSCCDCKKAIHKQMGWIFVLPFQKIARKCAQINNLLLALQYSIKIRIVHFDYTVK